MSDEQKTFEQPVPPKPKTKNPSEVFSSRCNPEVKQRFEMWAKGKGYSKKDATEYALQLAMSQDP